MVESLQRGTIEPGERQREYLRVIGQECRRLSSLVENLLDFSRIDRGRREYRFEPTDLPALVAQTADVMRPYATRQHVNLVCQTPAASALAPVSVDRGALQQALVNLADNAIKHSPAGSDVLVGLDVVTGGAVGSAREPGRIRLFVTDHGPGIPADEQERIFEPFYRRGSELRRETQGVGLGLSIVKHVAEAHGGRVVVSNNPGSGCTFAIEIPVPAEPAS
jgi:signal transduction histidine kinase